MPNDTERDPRPFRLRKLNLSDSPNWPLYADWREWQLIPMASARHACLLSLNLNPTRFFHNSWPDDIRDFYVEFRFRLRVLEENLQCYPERFSGNRFHKGKVLLSKFAAWALSLGWDIPIELAELAPKPHTDVPEKVSPGDTAAQNESSQTTAPKPCTKREILAAAWPLPNSVKLEGLLSDVPQWLNPACVARGAPGRGSSLWNPAQIAVCLATKKSVKMTALTPVIRNSFPEFLNEWENAVKLLESDGK